MSSVIQHIPHFDVLIVDDETDVHQVIGLVLKDQRVFDKPLNLHFAKSAKEAKHLINTKGIQPAVIFLDVMMETDNAGLVFLTELRKQPQAEKIQVTLLTGQAGLLSELEVASQYDINGYINKSQMTTSRIISALTTSIRNYLNLLALEKTTLALADSDEQRQQAHRYISSVLDSLSDALIVVDSKGIIVDANSAVFNVFGYTVSELTDNKLNVLMPENYAKVHDSYLHNYDHQQTRKNIMGRGRQLPAKRKNGSTFPMEITVTPFNSDKGNFYIGLIRDVSEKVQAQQEIYQLAYFDPVCHLPNLASFNKQLTEQLNHDDESVIALALIDLSGFYRINQTYGHDVGNQLLSLLVHRMDWVLPKNATLFRADGSNFLISLAHKTQEVKEIEQQIRLLADDILNAIKQDVVLGTSNHQIAANVGILVKDKAQIDIEKVLHQLEFTTLQAKKSGRNHSYCYDATLAAAETKKYLLEQELSKAIKRNELSIQLQPQYNQQQNIECSEALIRWNSAQLGFVPPNEFIQIAEESGLIINIGRWLIDNVCQTLQQLNNQGVISRIAINISARELFQPDFVSYVLNTINKYHINANQIIIEVTESVLASDIETVIKNMQQLTDKGVEFSIDDFGTGYSSLSYLNKLPISELKIDKSFIDEIKQNSQQVPLVDTIITMANALGLNIVAEGVEYPYQADYLAGHQNLLIQGYLYSKPLPKEQWLELLITNG